MVGEISFDGIQKASYLHRYRQSLTDFMWRVVDHYNMQDISETVPLITFRTIKTKTHDSIFTSEEAFQDAEGRFDREARQFDHCVNVDVGVDSFEDGTSTSCILRGLVANVYEQEPGDISNSSDAYDYFSDFERKPSYNNAHELSVMEYLRFEAFRLKVPFYKLRKAAWTQQITPFIHEKNGTEYPKDLSKDVIRQFNDLAKEYNAVLNVRDRLLHISDGSLFEYKIHATGVKYDLNKL